MCRYQVRLKRGGKVFWKVVGGYQDILIFQVKGIAVVGVDMGQGMDGEVEEGVDMGTAAGRQRGG